MDRNLSLAQSIRVARAITVAICFASTAIYAFVYSLKVLNSHPSIFFRGFSGIPWSNPAIFVLVTIAIATSCAAIAAFKGVFLHLQQSPSLLATLRVRQVMTCAMLEATAVFGLILGFLVGPSVASLSLIMFLVPVVGGALVFPSESSWTASQ